MVSLLKVIPKNAQAANYEVVVNGDVFRAENGSYGSATSRPGKTIITGEISSSERDHKFLVEHSEPLEFQIRGPVAKQVEKDISGFSPTLAKKPPAGQPPERAPGPPGSKRKAPPALQAPEFGIPGRDFVPSRRVKRGMPFSDNLLAEKSAVRNSRVGGLIQWHANQNPSREIPVKAVLSANNPERPLQAIKQIVSGGSSQAGTSGLGLSGSAVQRQSDTQVTFTVTGQQAEKLERIEGATFFMQGTSAASVGNEGVPVNGSSTKSAAGGSTNGSSGKATTASGGSNGGSTPPAQDRVVSGIPDALLGAGLFAAGTTLLVLTTSGGNA